jgi:hypothetical protein
MAENPSLSLPKQSRASAQLKSAYRLFARPEVTHESLGQVHWQLTRQEAVRDDGAVVLFVHDTTEFNYSKHRATTGIGPIGDGRGRGLMAHTCLAVVPTMQVFDEPLDTLGDASLEQMRADEPSAAPLLRSHLSQSAELLGVADQQLWCRSVATHRGETRTERSNRERESQVWQQTLEHIGRPPAHQCWICVGDRANDTFGYIERAGELGWHYLLRVSQDRRARTDDDELTHLLQHIRSQPPQGSCRLELPRHGSHRLETITLELCCDRLEVLPPWIGRAGSRAEEASVIRCWGSRSDGELIEWVLLTDLPVTTRQQLLQLLGYYAHRWLIEELHKCLKSGCHIEQSQLRSVEALGPYLSMQTIQAVRLLALRNLVHTMPELPAREVLDYRMIRLLILRLSLRADAATMTLHQFWRKVAQLGGFLGRKSDGEPGWSSLWEGWTQLQQLYWAATQSLGPP